MVQLLAGTPLYDEIFAGRSPLTSIASKFPSYADLENGFLNPANRHVLMQTGLLNSAQVHDVQQGARYLMEGLALFNAGRPTGFPSWLIPGFKDLVQSVTGPTMMKDVEVVERYMNADSPRELAGALVGTALGALGIAVPVVGTIAVAIVGLALGVYRAMEAATVVKDPESEAFKAVMYRYFPPFQKGGSETDIKLVEAVRAAIESHDWSTLFLPRYTGTWHGEERNEPGGGGGFAFAPGVATWSKKFDASLGETFTSTGHIGCIPGTDQITDIIQVSLPHDPAHDPGVARDFWNFMRGGNDPRVRDSQGVFGKSRVLDTGSFYPMTARLCGMMWNWASQRGNPMKFRIDTKVLEQKWRTYCETGLEYIRKVCYPWATDNYFNADYSKTGKTKDKEHYTFDPNANLEGYFGTAIFYGIGAFACPRTGLLDEPPVYKVQPAPFGVLGRDIARTRGYGQLNTPVFSNYSGAWLPIIEPSKWPDKCMGTRWERGPLPIKHAVADLRARQSWDLKHSAVAVATCRRADAAFVADPDLEDELLKSRAILLQHNARHQVNLDDVAADEPGIPGKPGTWREQLIAAGVHPMGKFLVGDIGVGLGEGKDPPPSLPAPPFLGANPDPWDPGPPPKEATLVLPGAGDAATVSWLAIGGTLAAGAAGAWWFLRRGASTRSAGRPFVFPKEVPWPR